MLARAALISLAFIHSATSTQAGDFQCPQAWWEQYKPGEFDRDFYQALTSCLKQNDSSAREFTAELFAGTQNSSYEMRSSLARFLMAQSRITAGEVAIIREENDQLVTKNDAVQEMNSKLESELSNLSLTIESLKNSKNDLVAQIAGLRQAEHNLKKDIENAQLQNAEIRQSLEVKDGRITILTADNEKLNNDVIALDGVVARRDKKIGEQIAEIGSLNSQIGANKAKIEKLSQKLSESETIRKSLEEKNSTIELEINLLRTQFSQLSIKFDQTSKHLRDANIQIEELIDEGQTLSEEKGILRDLLDIAENRIRASETELKNLTITVANLEGAITGLSVENSVLKDNQNQLGVENTKLLAELEEIRSKSSEHNQIIEKLEAIKTSLESKLDEVLRKNKSISDEIARLKIENSELNKLSTNLTESVLVLNSVAQGFENLQAAFKTSCLEIISGTIRFEFVNGSCVLPVDVLFATGRFDLSPAGRSALVELTKTLGHIIENTPAVSYRIEVAGHADYQPVSSNSQLKSNWHLSFERAYSVVSSMIQSADDQFGQHLSTDFAAKLVPVGYGSVHPRELGTDELSLSRNRRVEISIIK